MDEFDFAEFQQEQELEQRAAAARAELARVHAEQRERADLAHRQAHAALYQDMQAKMERLSQLPSWEGAGTVVTPNYAVEAAEAQERAKAKTRAVLGSNA